MISERAAVGLTYLSVQMRAVNDKVLMTPCEEADRLVRDLRVQRQWLLDTNPNSKFRAIF